VREPVFEQDTSHLPDLVLFGGPTLGLQPNKLSHVGALERVMASLYAHREAEALQQIAELVESNVGVGVSTQHFRQQFRRA